MTTALALLLGLLAGFLLGIPVGFYGCVWGLRDVLREKFDRRTPPAGKQN